MKRVATALTTLFLLLALVYLIQVVLLVAERRSWQAFDIGEKSIQDVDNARQAVAGAGVFVILISIAVGVLVIIWAHRSRKNLDAFGVADPPLSPGMAIGLWFIPIGSIFLGYNLLSGIWKGSDPDNPSPYWQGRANSWSFNLWWWLWTVGGVCTFFGGFYLDEEVGSVGEALNRNAASLVGTTLLLIACICAAISIGQFAKRQHDKAARLAPTHGGYGGPSSAPPPSWG